MGRQETLHVTYPQYLNPHGGYVPNPLTRGQKIAIGIGSAVVVGTGVFFLWPRKASAAGIPVTRKKTGTGGGGTGTPTNRPSGRPPGGDCSQPTSAYDSAFWDEGGQTIARKRIFDVFQEFGYAPPADRDTMNALGPDGALGGSDDVPNEQVRRFQKEYNAVSRWKKFLTGMGGLDRDGFVGACTVNGLKYIIDNIGEQDWQAIVASANADGFKAT